MIILELLSHVLGVAKSQVCLVIGSTCRGVSLKWIGIRSKQQSALNNGER